MLAITKLIKLLQVILQRSSSPDILKKEAMELKNKLELRIATEKENRKLKSENLKLKSKKKRKAVK